MQSSTTAISPAVAFPSSPLRMPPERSRKVRKRSEADYDSKPSVKIEIGQSHFYTKVPLTVLNTDLNSEDYASNIRRQATIRVKKMSSMTEPTSRFPKLNDCAHFHYDHVELGNLELCMYNEQEEEPSSLSAASAVATFPTNGVVPSSYPLPECLEANFTVRVSSRGKVWLIKRSYEDFRVLDKQLHSCIYDRRFSQLVELPKGVQLSTNREAVKVMLSHYVSRFSQIAGDMINCGPVLNWMEADNHGNHVIANEESAINIPAVAAAHVIKRYIAQAADEISLEVGDMISVIDMPPPDETAWWRGKNGFDVGFFPSQCIELISERLPPSVEQRVPKTPKPDLEDDEEVLRKHGKLITFLRSFILARPTKRGLKQRGILRERVFGCDLGEHLLNSGYDVPMVVKVCTDFIEKHGVVDGIYRLSGVASNIQRLRDEFDSDTMPDLSECEKDIHCVSSVCKLYFRELPNPLLTYQLYKHFEEAAMIDAEDQLIKMHDTVQQLPPPHYRTLEFLIRHLVKMAHRSDQTGMNVKNLAIVWAPNLLRAKDIETGSCAAFFEIKVQATVVEYLIKHADLIFNDKLLPDGANLDVSQEMNRPKSLVLSAPTKLITLEEAQARSSTINLDLEDKPKYIEVGGGPAALPKQYHTVIDLPYDRKRLNSKTKKLGWKLFFSRSGNKDSKRKIGAPSSPQVIVQFSTRNRGARSSLRSVRSEESLSSSEAINRKSDSDVEPEVKIHLRSRSSSVACVEAFRRSSSHNSFFEVDPEVIAAASRDMLDATIDESRDPESSNDPQGRDSPMWIDQSASSCDSEVVPSMFRDDSTKRLPSLEHNTSVRSKSCATEPEEKVLKVARSSFSGRIESRDSTRYKDVKNIRHSSSSVRFRDKVSERENLVLGRTSDSESIKGNAKHNSISEVEKGIVAGEIYNTTLSTGNDYTKEARNTNSNSSPTKSISEVRLQSTSDSSNMSQVKRRESRGSRRSKQDAQAQTPTESEFPRDSEETMFSLGDLEGAVLGSASPRKTRVYHEEVFDTEPEQVASPNGFSLENVLNEYDYMMEKYATHATTPDFYTSSDSIATVNWKEISPEQKQAMRRSASGLHVRRTPSDNHEKIEEESAPLASSDNSEISLSAAASSQRRSPQSLSLSSPTTPKTPPSSPSYSTERRKTPPSPGNASRTFVLSGVPSPITKMPPVDILSCQNPQGEDNVAPTAEFSSPELSPFQTDLRDFSKELDRVEQMLAANELPSFCRVNEDPTPSDAAYIPPSNSDITVQSEENSLRSMENSPRRFIPPNYPERLSQSDENSLISMENSPRRYGPNRRSDVLSQSDDNSLRSLENSPRRYGPTHSLQTGQGSINPGADVPEESGYYTLDSENVSIKENFAAGLHSMQDSDAEAGRERYGNEVILQEQMRSRESSHEERTFTGIENEGGDFGDIMGSDDPSSGQDSILISQEFFSEMESLDFQNSSDQCLNKRYSVQESEAAHHVHFSQTDDYKSPENFDGAYHKSFLGEEEYAGYVDADQIHDYDYRRKDFDENMDQTTHSQKHYKTEGAVYDHQAFSLRDEDHKTYHEQKGTEQDRRNPSPEERVVINNAMHALPGETLIISDVIEL